jgi:hypothetical protein
VNWQRARWLGVGKDTGLAARCVGLIGWMAVAALPISLVAYSVHGTAGLKASLVAAAICLLGAVPPLVLSKLMAGPQYAMQHLAFGMLFRMGAPLMAGVIAHVKHWSLLESGFLLCLVGYFWVGLVFDTLNLLSTIDHRSHRSAQRAGAAGHVSARSRG